MQLEGEMEVEYYSAVSVLYDQLKTGHLFRNDCSGGVITNHPQDQIQLGIFNRAIPFKFFPQKLVHTIFIRSYFCNVEPQH